MRRLLLSRMMAIGTCVLLANTASAALDEAQVKSIMKKSNCFKCHVPDGKDNMGKDGPAYAEMAEKLRGKPDAESRVYKHVTTTEKVEIKGKKQDHEPLKTKDEAEIKAIVQWILNR